MQIILLNLADITDEIFHDIKLIYYHFIIFYIRDQGHQLINYIYHVILLMAICHWLNIQTQWYTSQDQPTSLSWHYKCNTLSSEIGTHD